MDDQSRSSVFQKKTARDRLIAWASTQPSWAIGFLDEVWWSRFALPRLHAWQNVEQPVRLVEQTWQKGDPDPKAFACYGVLWQQGPAADPLRKQMSLRFVTGRPVSAITTQCAASGVAPACKRSARPPGCSSGITPPCM